MTDDGGEIIKRLKRAHGHLASVIEMIEAGRPCVDLAFVGRLATGELQIVETPKR